MLGVIITTPFLGELYILVRKTHTQDIYIHGAGTGKSQRRDITFDNFHFFGLWAVWNTPFIGEPVLERLAWEFGSGAKSRGEGLRLALVWHSWILLFGFFSFLASFVFLGLWSGTPGFPNAWDRVLD